MFWAGMGNRYHLLLIGFFFAIHEGSLVRRVYIELEVLAGTSDFNESS